MTAGHPRGAPEHQHWEELAVGHVLNALEPADEAAFAGHLPSCDACRRLVSDMGEAAAELAYAPEAPEAPPSLWAGIAAGVADSDRPPLAQRDRRTGEPAAPPAVGEPGGPGTNVGGTGHHGGFGPGSSLSGTDLPSTPRPGTPRPDGSQAGTSPPGSSVPGTSGPGSSRPGTSPPGSSVPSGSQPGTSRPGSSVPSGSGPGATPARRWSDVPPAAPTTAVSREDGSATRKPVLLRSAALAVAAVLVGLVGLGGAVLIGRFLQVRSDKATADRQLAAVLNCAGRPGCAVVPLKAPAGTASAIALLRDGNVQLLVDNLAPSGRDSGYVLWAVKPGGAVAGLGRFVIADRSRQILSPDLRSPVSAGSGVVLAITLEPGRNIPAKPSSEPALRST